MSEKSDLIHGTLALMVLRTIDIVGPIHGYGIARRIEQISGGLLELNQGTIYPCLLQLEQAGWITAKWGISENNRKARFYAITRSGRKQLLSEAESWKRMSEVIGRFADPAGDLS